MSVIRSYAVDQYSDELQTAFNPDNDYYISVATNPDKLPTYIMVGLDEDEDTASIFYAYDIGEDDKMGVIFKRRYKYIQNRSHVSNVVTELDSGSTVTSIIAEELINQYASGDPIESWTELTSGSSITVNVGNAKKNKVTIEENAEFTFTNADDHDSFILRITQDDTGSRTVSWSSGITIEWLSDNEVNSTAEAVTIYGFVKYADNSYYGLKLGETQ
jgi:hypothetical protein